MTFFKTVCGTFPDCRFLHYNLPRAQRIIHGPEYRRIADEVPNLVATKNSTTEYARTADLMEHVSDIQHFFLEGNFAMGCTLGECSLLCSWDVLFPKTTWRFFEAGLNRDVDELFRIRRAEPFESFPWRRIWITAVTGQHAWPVIAAFIRVTKDF